MLGLVNAQVQQCVSGFKEFIESRGAETGAWRGEVHHSERQPERLPGTTKRMN